MGFILLLSLTTPQNQLVAAQGNNTRRVQQGQLQVPPSLTIQSRRLSREEVKRLLESSRRSGVDCFALRSYLFEREDGNAPVLAGATTCTPNTVRPEQVMNPPAARLVLQ